MQILFLGAGGTGGYFGGRLLESGADVSFLLRPKRAESIRQNGLIVKSTCGDIDIKNVNALTSIENTYDLIVLSCKAYDLDSSIESIAPAVGNQSCILPLLNGRSHIQKLQDRFGNHAVLGGLCIISATLDAEGQIQHLNDAHTLKYGELNGEMSERVKRIESVFQKARFVSNASSHIVQDIWEKWVMIASLAAMTTLMRASIGQIVSCPGGAEFGAGLFDECMSILAAHGNEVRSSFVSSNKDRLKDCKSTLAASMLRDLEHGGKVESDQIIGDLIACAEEKNLPVPFLKLAYCNLKVYELKRQEK